MKIIIFQRFICLKGALVGLALGLILFSWAAASTAAVFTDDLGRVVNLKAPPRRIVAMAPNLTEILYYLGLGDRVVGVTRFSTYPARAVRKPKVGTYINLNVEKIISLNPDLAIGTKDGNRPNVVKLLEQAGIPVFIVNPRKVGHVVDAIAVLGQLCGVGKRGKKLAFQMGARVRRVFQKTVSLKRPLVFLQINVEPIMTVNKNTFHHD
ncbi:MAG: ABC transporter substrate-binding protein, partial [Deltaproteobacteria bacterium]|nr:ABC transporter substrate-binding protein [Deltaproteobacteria bacterium]